MALGIRGQLTELQQLNAPDKLVIFAMGRLWRPIVPDAERAPIYSVSRSLHVQAHQSGSSRRAIRALLIRGVIRDTMSRVYMCLKLLHISNTWHVPASSLRERATVALMTGCEASRTKYRIGSEWRQEDPSGSSIRLRAREGQYGEIKQRAVRAVSRRQTY